MTDSESNMPESIYGGVKVSVESLVSPRTISKSIDQQGRDKTANDIAALRSQIRTIETQSSAGEQARNTTANLENELDSAEYAKRQELEARMKRLDVRLKHWMRITDLHTTHLNEQINTIIKDKHALEQDRKEIERELENLRRQLPELPDPRAMLEAYYQKIENTPLSNEQKRTLLKPEVLANLTDEQYIKLWRRLNPYFLAHVTRQGFRDHTGNDAMVNHDSTFHEFNNGFVDVMDSSRSIYPPLARVGITDRSEETIAAFLDNFLIGVDDEEKAKNMFSKFLTRHLAAAPRYPDITATHFASQIVSDKYYGGEANNEVFFIYPSDVLASQYPFAFNGWEKDFTRPQSETKWNDVFFWSDPDNPGIPVDSGIVFLPANTQVDPETGSKYASLVVETDGKQRRELIENEELVNELLRWGERFNNSALMEQFRDFDEEQEYYLRQAKGELFENLMADELMDRNVDKSEAGRLAEQIAYELRLSKQLTAQSLRNIIDQSTARWRKAENPVPAKLYWRNYFLEHPNLKPKHIYYYEGQPTESVYKFMLDNNIGSANTSKTDGPLLGFQDNHVEDMDTDLRANAGLDDLIKKAEKIIEARYGKGPIE